MSVADVRELYREGRLLPFVGAGASMSVRWKGDGDKIYQGVSWSQLVDQAARQLGFDDPDLLRDRGDDIQILEYYREVKGSLAELSNWLLRLMRPPDESLLSSDLHTSLASLVHCSVMYTTNYDDFLERALVLHGRSTRVVANEAQMAASHQPGRDITEIVKFHGDFSSPERMVLSESDYYRRLRLSDEMDYRLRSDILGRALLFVGYSFRDWNVAYLFNLVQDVFGPLPDSPNGARAYILVPNPSAFEIKLFRARSIQVIPLTGSDPHAEIAGVLQEISRA